MAGAGSEDVVGQRPDSDPIARRRHLSSDPSTIPVFAPLRLSRALRPVRV
jgi:hypothetical protein